MKKIILYTCSPLNVVYAKKIFIDQISKNYELEIWTKFKNNNTYFKNSKNYSIFGHHQKLVKNNLHLFLLLKNISSKNFIFFYIDYNASLDLTFLFLIKIFKIKFIVPPRRTPFSFSKNRMSIFKRIFKKNILEIIYLILKKIKLIIFKFLSGANIIQNAEIIFVCGEKGKSFWSYFSPKKMITINSVDLKYDISDFKFDKKYAVYIDESKIYSPDLALVKSDPSTATNLNLFYKNLNIFFDNIEKKLSLEVLISCSLKYNYESDKYFDGRKIFYGDTNNLIKNSDLVICHQSSGYWQAIYDKKKLIFLTDVNLEKYNQNYQILNNANFLNSSIYETNSKLNNIDLRIDESKYDCVLKKYFLSPDELNYDKVILDVIKNI